MSQDIGMQVNISSKIATSFLFSIYLVEWPTNHLNKKKLILKKQHNKKQQNVSLKSSSKYFLIEIFTLFYARKATNAVQKRKKII